MPKMHADDKCVATEDEVHPVRSTTPVPEETNAPLPHFPPSDENGHFCTLCVGVF